MVRIGLLRVDNPWINLAVAIVLFLIAFIFKNISDQGRIVVVLAGFVLIVRAGVSLFQYSRSSQSRADRFAKFAEEDKLSNTSDDV